MTIALPLSPALFSVQSSTFFLLLLPWKKSIDDDAGGLFWFSIFKQDFAFNLLDDEKLYELRKHH